MLPERQHWLRRRPWAIPAFYVLGFGIPGLGLPGVPNDRFFWAIVALTLIYSAYVSEVYRAGIDSVHPSQDAAARSLGLSQLQSLRHVVVPQAVRRVVPPLLMAPAKESQPRIKDTGPEAVPPPESCSLEERIRHRLVPAPLPPLKRRASVAAKSMIDSMSS